MKTLQSGILELSKYPLTLLTLTGVILILLVFIRLKKVTLTTRIVSQLSIGLALSVILNLFIFSYIQCFLFRNRWINLYCNNWTNTC